MNSNNSPVKFNLFESDESNNSGIYTFTQLLKNIFNYCSVNYCSFDLNSLNVNQYLSDDFKNIINIGVNSKNATHWLMNNHGKSNNIIILHDLPILTNHLFTSYLPDTKFTRFLSRLIFLKFPKFGYRKLFSASDILVATNSNSYEYLIDLKRNHCLDFKIMQIDHPIYKPIIIQRTKSDLIKEIRIGTFGHLNKLKKFSEIPIAIDLIRRRRPDIFKNISVSIMTKPNDFFGKNDFNLLCKNINNLNLNDKIYIGSSLPDDLIDEYIESLDILVLPYRNSLMMSSSGPVSYAMSFSIPVIGSGFIAKTNKYVYPFDINSVLSLYNALIDATTCSEKWNENLYQINCLSNEVNWKSTCSKFLNSDSLCI